MIAQARAFVLRAGQNPAYRPSDTSMGKFGRCHGQAWARPVNLLCAVPGEESKLEISVDSDE